MVAECKIAPPMRERRAVCTAWPLPSARPSERQHARLGRDTGVPLLAAGVRDTPPKRCRTPRMPRSRAHASEPHRPPAHHGASCGIEQECKVRARLINAGCTRCSGPSRKDGCVRGCAVGVGACSCCGRLEKHGELVQQAVRRTHCHADCLAVLPQATPSECGPRTHDCESNHSMQART